MPTDRDLVPRLEPRQGIGPAEVVTMLDRRLVELRNVNGITHHDLQANYVQWVIQTENELRGVVTNLSLHEWLLTDRYWQIHRMGDLSSPFYVIDAEREVQRAWLEIARDDLRRRLERARQAPGRPTVLDTNVLLHYQQVDELPWHDVLGPGAVRLVLPLRVVEEADGKKYSSQNNLRKRARKVMPALEGLIGPGGAPNEIQPDVTLEILTNTHVQRADDADTDVIETAVELVQFGLDLPTFLITGDTGMRTRAQAVGLRVIKLGDAYSRSLEDRPSTD